MPQISAIEPQKKTPNKFNVYVDGIYRFPISLEDLTKQRLKIGKDITETEIKQFEDISDTGKIFDRVLHFLSYRPRSEKEIRDFLIRKKVDDKKADVVLEKLRKINFINDLEFAKWWVENRLKFRPQGKIVLKLELTKKGIAKEVIDNILDQINPGKQQQIADLLAQKKLLRYKNNLDKKQIYQKLAAFLARRGFDWETIKSAIDTAYQKM